MIFNRFYGKLRKDLSIFELWVEILKHERLDDNEQDKILLEAKSAILISLPNFYYDDESLMTMGFLSKWNFKIINNIYKLW